MPKWLAQEFIRQRKFNDTAMHWTDELNEQYVPYDWQEFVAIAKKAGFSPVDISKETLGYELNFYHIPKEEFQIINSKGHVLEDMDFASNLTVSFTKTASIPD